MENVEKRVDIKLVQHWENTSRRIGRARLGARAYIARPNFHSSAVFSDNLIAIQLKRSKLIYNKPIYVGFSVLELSKLTMYKFHYNYMKKKYEGNVSLNYIDTDSFIYDIKTEDFYADIREDLQDYFDTSSYPQANIFKFPHVNKKVLGMMKDECGGKVMKEFVGLRPKMYSYKVDSTEIKKVKGIRKSAISNLSIEDFKLCLLEDKLYYDTLYVLRSKLHEMYTQNIQKLVLSNLDDKRIIRQNKIDTYAYGHYRAIENEL